MVKILPGERKREIESNLLSFILFRAGMWGVADHGESTVVLVCGATMVVPFFLGTNQHNNTGSCVILLDSAFRLPRLHAAELFITMVTMCKGAAEDAHCSSAPQQFK